MHLPSDDKAILLAAERIISRHLREMKVEVYGALLEIKTLKQSPDDLMEEFRSLINSHEHDILGDSVRGWMRDLEDDNDYRDGKRAYAREVAAAE